MARRARKHLCQVRFCLPVVSLLLLAFAHLICYEADRDAVWELPRLCERLRGVLRLCSIAC